MAHPTEKLLVRCFQIEQDFRGVVFPLREDNVKKISFSAGFYSISVSKKTVVLIGITRAVIEFNNFGLTLFITQFPSFLSDFYTT